MLGLICPKSLSEIRRRSTHGSHRHHEPHRVTVAAAACTAYFSPVPHVTILAVSLAIGRPSVATDSRRPPIFVRVQVLFWWLSFSPHFRRIAATPLRPEPLSRVPSAHAMPRHFCQFRVSRYRPSLWLWVAIGRTSAAVGRRRPHTLVLGCVAILALISALCTFLLLVLVRVLPGMGTPVRTRIGAALLRSALFAHVLLAVLPPHPTLRPQFGASPAHLLALMTRSFEFVFEFY